MTTWKQQGAKKVSYEPASPECTTNFQTNATIIGPDGKEITPSSIEQDEYGVIPSWSNIPEGSKIVWECRTLSGIGSSSAVSDIWEKEDADKVGKPDRVSIDLQALDLAYVTKITDDVINNLSPQEEEMLLTDIEGVTLLITERVMENMNESLVLKSIYSTIIETGSDGYSTGEIPIARTWPKGALTMSMSYGYNRQSEGTGGESWFLGINNKAYSFWVEDMGPTIVGLAISFIVPGGFIIGGALLGAELLADLAIMNNKMARDAMGMVGLNKYNCAFPADGGWVHTYAFGYETEEAEQEASDEYSDENKELGTAMAQYVKTQGIVASIATGSIGLAVLLIVLARIKSKKKGGGE